MFHIPASTWYPMGSSWVHGHRPPIGELVPFRHGVWRVLSVQNLERALWNEADEAAFLAWTSRVSPRAWPSEPYRVEVEHVGGHNSLPRDGRGVQGSHGALTIHYGSSVSWRWYEAGRWPMCSCCGEPMPCRAQMEDDQVRAAAEMLEAHAGKLPGCCWACGEPVTSRQHSVAFPGINLDLPGGPEVVFHLRKKCRDAAKAYERRWTAEQAS